MEYQNYQPWVPQPPRPPKALPVGKRELVFALLSVFCGVILCNFTLFGGFNLGFALAALLCMGCCFGYLGKTGDGYSRTLLILCAIIAAGFARSDDGFVKFVMVLFLGAGLGLSLCLTANRNRRPTGGITSLLDGPRAVFTFGFGQMPPALQGLKQGLRSGSPAVRKGLAVVAGLAIAAPLVAVMILLLVSADAAFDGLVGLLPEFDLWELVPTLIFGLVAGCVLFAMGLSLKHSNDPEPPVKEQTHFFDPLTVNTVLGAVAALFLVYLLSQLAYFVGGFRGILPEDFTLAQYARRGFFEMAALSGIDLGLIALSVGLVAKKEGKAPRITRLLCLFIGLVSLFFISAASAKMLLYIDGYGLTRLRLLTQIIMVFLGFATVVVCLWLFRPRLPYMKVILIAALVIGAVVIWVDVDTVVAYYNVSAYLDGRLDTIDMTYLSDLGQGAIPQIARLTDCADPDIATHAQTLLRMPHSSIDDLRSWNFAAWFAQRFLS